MRHFRRLLVALIAASVAAKTGTTPDPMYELDAVCADWWHPAADGCFNSELSQLTTTGKAAFRSAATKAMRRL